LTLLSLEFFALALAACVLLPVLRGGLRTGVFLALNVAFAASFLEPEGMLSTAAFLALGYGAALWTRGGGRGRVPAAVGLMTVAFVYLRGYDLLRLVLPDGWLHELLATAGLSFLFFKMLHVIVDSASGTLGDLRVTTYVNYCLNFTTFLMGPIQRYQNFDEQWRGEKASIEPGFEAHLGAVNRVLRGLVKKFVVAELLWHFSIRPGMPIESLGALQLLVRTYVFYLYLYCDFSGYCDVVIGVGSLMGVRPPENFNLPFLARNVSDYWLRVHRTLTTWLTDYVFNPCFAALLRRMTERFGTYVPMAIALLVTMLVSGLWHGTTMAFVYFGLLHGVYLVIQHGYSTWMRKRLGRKRFAAFSRHIVVHGAAVFVTYNLTSLAYLFFVLDADEVARVVTRVVAG
jgi:membrane protein involved in D-alanine export